MEIIGSHDNSIVEDNLECRIVIEKGILGVYAHSNRNYHKLNQPLNEKEWKLERNKLEEKQACSSNKKQYI